MAWGGTGVLLAGAVVVGEVGSDWDARGVIGRLQEHDGVAGVGRHVGASPAEGGVRAALAVHIAGDLSAVVQRLLKLADHVIEAGQHVGEKQDGKKREDHALPLLKAPCCDYGMNSIIPNH